MMAMMDEVLADPESDASVWGLGTRVDLVACGDEDGTSPFPCGWPPGFFLLLNFEISLMMFASSVLMAVWAGNGDLTMSTFARSTRQSCGRTRCSSTLRSADQWWPLPPFGQTSREGADPLWPQPCRQEPAISPVCGGGAVPKQSSH
jgi:hypothetical protein